MAARDAHAGTGLDTRTGRQQPARKILWAVQEAGGQAQSFTFILAGYGDAWVAVGLARALGPEHTVYGLQPPGAGGPTTAPALAAIYVQHLRAAQPHGPYYLAGYSAGGLMALEVASQLRAQGERVGLVALLDPLFIRYTRFEHVCYMGLQCVCRLVEEILPRKLRLLQILAAMFEDRGLDTHLQVLAGYRPVRYPDEIVFYRARWSVCGSPMLVRQCKWFTRARVKVEKVPGDHHTFIRPPHVKELATRLRSELQKAGAGPSQ